LIFSIGGAQETTWYSG